MYLFLENYLKIYYVQDKKLFEFKLKEETLTPIKLTRSENSNVKSEYKEIINMTKINKQNF